MTAIENAYMEGEKYSANFAAWKRSRSYSRTSDHYYDYTATNYHYEGVGLISGSSDRDKHCFAFTTTETCRDPETLESYLKQLMNYGNRYKSMDSFLQLIVNRIEKLNQSIPLESNQSIPLVFIDRYRH